jgi:hypothetical protein
MLTRAGEALAPELAIAAVAVGSWLTFRLLGPPALAAPLGLIGLMLAAWKAGA